MGKEDQDTLLDEGTDGTGLDAEGGEEIERPDAGASRGERRFQKLANENRELHDRIARMEGRLEAAGQRPVAEPQFASDEEKYLFQLTKHAEALEAKVRKLEERDTANEVAQQRSKVVSVATKGLKFSDAALARETLEAWISTHPKADEDDVRAYAERLSRSMRPEAEKDKEYLERKKADQTATRRPAQMATTVTPPKVPEARLSTDQMWQKARESALKRIEASQATK